MMCDQKHHSEDINFYSYFLTEKTLHSEMSKNTCIIIGAMLRTVLSNYVVEKVMVY